MDTSFKDITVQLPASWHALTRSQLYYVFSLIADNLSVDQMKAYCFFTFSGVTILHRYGNGYMLAKGEARLPMSAMDIAYAMRALDWLESVPDMPVLIDKIGRHRAVDEQLHGVAFGDYIACDNYYQGYLQTQDTALLVEMAKILYSAERIRINRAGKMSVFYWFTSVKSLFSRSFPYFFQPVSNVSPDNLLEEGAPLAKRITDAMNAQIRALTKGDVTKEDEVLKMDVWRALTELDALAKEYIDYKRKYGK